MRESLRDTRVQFVTMDEYDAAVAQADLPPSQRRPVMALVFYDSSNSRDVNPSRGLAALLRTWHERYQGLKQVAVCVSELDNPPQSVVDDVGRRFSLRRIPALIVYRCEAGRLVRLTQMNGGVCVYDTSEGRGSYLGNLELIPPFREDELLR